MYVISIFAQLAGVHPQTVRNYERSGLLHPQRTAGGSRRFSDGDLAALARIRSLVNEGVNLEGVRRILALEDELAATRARAAALEVERREAVERAHRQYRRDLVPVAAGTLVVVRGTR